MANWLVRLETLLTSVLQVFRAYPWCAALVNNRATRSDSYLLAVEAILDILRR